MDIRELLLKHPVDTLSVNLSIESEKREESVDAGGSKKQSRIDDGNLYCTACSVRLEEETAKPHYRLDWHRYNVHRKLLRQEPISEEQFLDTIDELSSVSGSDTSEDDSSDEKLADRNIRKLIEKVGRTEEKGGDSKTKRIKTQTKPKVFFSDDKEKVYSVYRCLLSPKKVDDTEVYMEELRRLGQPSFSCAVIMLGGGHFAAAIFNSGVPTDHKTFHSYTVRAKQGGSQSSRDAKSGGGSHPKSAGASLRRYNEAAFSQHVSDLLAEWQEKLAACTLILFRAVSSNSAILFGGKTPLMDKSDPRLRSIPIPTRRATFAEVKRVFRELMTVEVLDRKELEEIKEAEKVEDQLKKKEPTAKPPQTAMESIITSMQSSQLSDDDIMNLDYKVSPKKKASRPKKKAEPLLPEKIIEVELFDGEMKIVDKIVTALQEGNNGDFNEHFVTLVNAVVGLQVDGENISREMVLSRRRGEEGYTLLHRAAIYGRQVPVWTLLDSGSDPSVLDYKGRPPYVVCSDKDTRNVFRKFFGTFPDKYDYSKAQIPSPLTDESEKAKAARLAEKRKQQKIAKKEKEKELKKKMEERRAEDAERQQAEEEKQRFLQLSDREKRALAAERRLLSQAASLGTPPSIVVRCFLCGQDITGKVPFEYSNNVFCSTVCLASHRKKMAGVKL